MKVGHARHNLTPQGEFYLIGYRSDNRMYPASGVHDEIFCNSLLFEQDGKEIFLFSADYLEFEEEMAEDVKTLMQKRFNIERDSILLCATHNHSSVVSYHKGWYTGKFDQKYYDFLLETIQQSYLDCKANLQEVTAKLGKKVILGYYGNRNHPGQPADNEVIVVKFFDAQGNAVAGLVNWAVHSTVISANNTWLTSELAGEVDKKLENSFGFYPAMVVGAAGDCSNRNERQGNDFKELERVSSALAAEIAAIPVDTELVLDELRCQTVYHTIHHNMEFVHEELREEIAKFRTKLENEPDPEKREFFTKKIKNLSKDLELDHFHLDAKGLVFHLGGLQLFVFPGELSSRFGIEMKAACPVQGIICGYTNGYYGYFMPVEEYGLSFETIGSPVPKKEPEKMVEKMIQASICLGK
jgi:hypothetical protein